MSSRHPGARADSTRQSTDCTASEGEEEGALTDITSVSAMEVDDAMYDDSDDAQSTYAPSYYPNMKFYDAPIDMGLDGADRAASTRSLCVPDLGYIELHGRRYCKSYFMPNDEHELARQTLVHQVHLHAFEGELVTVPLDNPEKVLDIGTGTGEWAIRMGELYPDCEVIGTDISAIQETSVPPNVFFEIDDAEVPWERPQNSFDLVHMRHTSGAFKDIGFVYRQAFECLKPGGWIENKDFDTNASKSLEGRHWTSIMGTQLKAVKTLFETAFASSQRAGRPWGPEPLDPRVMIEAGFVDVRVIDHVFPLKADGPRGNAGKMHLIAVLEGLEAHFLRILTEHGGMTPETVRELCDEAAREIVEVTRDPVRSREATFKIRVLTGRKPYAHEMRNSGEEASTQQTSSTSESSTPSPHKSRKSRKKARTSTVGLETLTIKEGPQEPIPADLGDESKDVQMDL